MKAIEAGIALHLLAGVLVAQQSPAKVVESAGARCIYQVRELVQLLNSGHVPVPPEVAAARAACDKYTTMLADANAAGAQDALQSATRALDRYGLTAEALFQRETAALDAVDRNQRFYALAELAKQAFDLAHMQQADAYARELLQDARQYRDDWNYGNAIYYGNFVLGRIAAQQGNVQKAGQYLLEAGRTPGSPQLNSFGPNMTLAKELLERGQSTVVIQFFVLCKNFWTLDRGKLDEWSAAVRSGDIPRFKQNLSY